MPQMNKLGQGCDILVATTGRLLAILREKALQFGNPKYRDILSLDNLSFIVYDEADELLSESLKDVSSKMSKTKTFKDEVDEVELRLPTKKHLYHWYFSSQYSKEQSLRAEGFMRLE